MHHKDVHQGDPLSPYMFKYNSAVLCKVALTAQVNNLVTGLALDLVEGGVAILQYADDAVLCFEKDIDQALNIKLLLYIF